MNWIVNKAPKRSETTKNLLTGQGKHTPDGVQWGDWDKAEDALPELTASEIKALTKSHAPHKYDPIRARRVKALIIQGKGFADVVRIMAAQYGPKNKRATVAKSYTPLSRQNSIKNKSNFFK